MWIFSFEPGHFVFCVGILGAHVAPEDLPRPATAPGTTGTEPLGGAASKPSLQSHLSCSTVIMKRMLLATTSLAKRSTFLVVIILQVAGTTGVDALGPEDVQAVFIGSA